MEPKETIPRSPGQPAASRQAWSLTTSGTVHGAMFGIATLVGGFLATSEPERRADPVVRTVLAAPREFPELVELEPQVLEPDPELDDSELVEEPAEPIAPEPERPRENPLAQATLVTSELLWSVDLSQPVREPTEAEPVAMSVATPVEPVPEEPEIALEAEPAIVEALVLEAPSPRYPRLSVRRGEEGTVECRLHIGAEGHVTRVEVLSSSGFERLDEAALEALAKWRFAPRQEDGRSVATTIRHPVTFQLESR